MRKKFLGLIIILFTLGLMSNVYAQGGLYFGIQAGYSAQKPSLKNVEFNTDTTFLYGMRAGLKIMMIAVEINYFQAAHNLDMAELIALDWGGRQVDYNFIGLNLKYFFPFFLIHPYLTMGYGYYTANIHEIDKDRDRGYNLGIGLELHLGSRLSLLAEGKYHHVSLDIDQRKFKIGDFTLSGGLNIYF